jgi:hypothetical protein
MVRMSDKDRTAEDPPENQGSDLVDPDAPSAIEPFQAWQIGRELDGSAERARDAAHNTFMDEVQSESFPKKEGPNQPDPTVRTDTDPDPQGLDEDVGESIIPDLAEPNPIWPASGPRDVDADPDAVRPRRLPRWAIPLSVVAAGFVLVVIWLLLNGGNGEPAAGEPPAPSDEPTDEVQSQAIESSDDEATEAASDAQAEAPVSEEAPTPAVVGWLVPDALEDWLADLGPFDVDSDPDPTTEFTAMYVAVDSAADQTVVGLCFGGAVEGSPTVGFDLFVAEVTNILYRPDGSYKASPPVASLDLAWRAPNNPEFTLGGFTPEEGTAVMARSLVAGAGPPAVYSSDEVEAILHPGSSNPVADTAAWAPCP